MACSKHGVGLCRGRADEVLLPAACCTNSPRGHSWCNHPMTTKRGAVSSTEWGGIKVARGYVGFPCEVLFFFPCPSCGVGDPRARVVCQPGFLQCLKSPRSLWWNQTVRSRVWQVATGGPAAGGGRTEVGAATQLGFSQSCTAQAGVVVRSVSATSWW